MVNPRKRIGLIGLSAKGSKASAEAAAKEYKLDGVATYDSPAAISSDPNVDIVAVSVNVPQHYRLIRPALEAVQVAKAKGVRTLIGLQGRQSPAVVKAKEIVASGRLGKILGTSMYGHGWLFGPTIGQAHLYTATLEAGANIVTIAFGHAVDALCYVLGEMKDLSATLANNRPELDLVADDGTPERKVSKTAHDHISMTGRLVKGDSVVDVTYAGGVSRTGRNFYCEINGTDGSLVLQGGENGGHVQMFTPTVKLFTDTSVEELQMDNAVDFTLNVGKAWDAWAGVGLDQGYSVTTFEDALVRHKMIDAIYRSAERGTRENYL